METLVSGHYEQGTSPGKMVVCVKKLNLAEILVNKLRNERGWTQDELADRLRQNDDHENGCSRREVRQKWERILCSSYIS